MYFNSTFPLNHCSKFIVNMVKTRNFVNIYIYVIIIFILVPAWY